jgi:hypothetical protein
MGSCKAKSGPESIRELKCSYDVARDLLSSYLKDRTLALRLTTLEIGKKSKQKLEHKVPNLPASSLWFDYTIFSTSLQRERKRLPS